MHEIFIAESIIEIAEAKAREQGALSVQVIKLLLGQFTTIVQEALEFAFEVARQGTLAEDARLEIEVVPMVLRCAVCDKITQPIKGVRFTCEQCGFPVQIISGEELRIEYIEVETKEERFRWKELENESRNECQFKPMS